MSGAGLRWVGVTAGAIRRPALDHEGRSKDETRLRPGLIVRRAILPLIDRSPHSSKLLALAENGVYAYGSSFCGVPGRPAAQRSSKTAARIHTDFSSGGAPKCPGRRLTGGFGSLFFGPGPAVRRPNGISRPVPPYEQGFVGFCLPVSRNVPDLTSCSAVELARRIRAREVSAVEVLEAHLDRIERQNPAVNAVVTLDAERAHARANAADAALARDEVWGPLHGVPFTVKDQFSTAGLRTTYALPHYADFVPAADAPQVACLKEAGGVLMGKTNLPLAAYDWQCDHPNFGRANNPWALDCTPGGSSGGSAAALAAGLTPLELGADVAGSIRIPSHFCGVTGLRPTEDGPLRGIRPPDRPATVRHIAVAGPMARTVEDLQLEWAALCGADPAASVPATPSPDALRIAVTPELGGVPADTDTQRVLRDATTAWGAAGCEVKRRPAPFDVEDAFDTWARIQGFELTAGLPAPLRTPPLKQLVWQGYVRSKFGSLAGRMAKGASLGPRGYFQALDRRAALADGLDAFFDDWDLWVTPVAATPTFTHRPTGAARTLEGVSVPYALPIAPYNCPTAVLGHPILTLPAGRTPTGRPIGLQVHARHGADATLLAAGRRLEAVLGCDPAPASLAEAPRTDDSA